MTLGFLKKLRRAGLSHVSYGLESGSKNVLGKMGKHIDLPLAAEVIRNSHTLGIHTTVNIIVGFPDETENDILESADFIRKNSGFMDEVYFHPLVLMRGSPLDDLKDRFCIDIPEGNRISLWHTKDGRNNYKVRLERIELYKKVLKDKFVSNISMFNHYLNIADQYYGEGNKRFALEYYLKAKELTEDNDKLCLLEDRIRRCQEIKV